MVFVQICLKYLKLAHFTALVIGQGIAGSLLAWRLHGAGQSVMIIDNANPESSSKVAAGLYNPITGRQMVKTWMADEIFPTLAQFYDDLEEQLNAKFHFQMPIYRPFHSAEEQNDWQSKAANSDYESYIDELKTHAMGIDHLADNFGGIKLKLSGYIDLPVMLKSFRDYFILQNMITEKSFDFFKLEVNETGCKYLDFTADQIIFCEGVSVAANPFWTHLRFKPVKGEILNIKCDLPQNLIVNRGVFIIPRNGYFRVGSTYDHQVLDTQPTQRAKTYLEEKFLLNYKGKYEIVGHQAGIRPATFDRKPFIGFHKKYKNVGIFNGFGTKGVSMVPYFSKMMVDNIVSGSEILEEVEANR